jgi:hypothetical protein
MESNEKYVRYADLLKLQMKYREGIIKDEDLTYDEVILLNRLYDMQLEKLEQVNERYRAKIKRYKRKYMNS